VQATRKTLVRIRPFLAEGAIVTDRRKNRVDAVGGLPLTSDYALTAKSAVPLAREFGISFLPHVKTPKQIA